LRLEYEYLASDLHFVRKYCDADPLMIVSL